MIRRLTTRGDTPPGPIVTDPQTFDQTADEYAQTVNEAIGASGESVEFFADYRARLAARLVRVPTPRNILDFGCGIGMSTRSLAVAFPESQIVGFDHSSRSIDLAREQSSGETRISYLSAAEEPDLPSVEGGFDLIFASAVFHHIEPGDRQQCADRIAQALGVGGEFLIFEHNPMNPLTRRVVRTCPFDEGVVLLYPRHVRRLLRKAGLECAHTYHYIFFPRMLRWLRRFEPLLSWLPLGGQFLVRGSKSRGP